MLVSSWLFSLSMASYSIRAQQDLGVDLRSPTSDMGLPASSSSWPSSTGSSSFSESSPSSSPRESSPSYSSTESPSSYFSFGDSLPSSRNSASGLRLSPLSSSIGRLSRLGSQRGPTRRRNSHCLRSSTTPSRPASCQDAVPYAVRHESELEDVFLGRRPGRLEARPRGAALEPGLNAGVDALARVGAGVVQH